MDVYSIPAIETIKVTPKGRAGLNRQPQENFVALYQKSGNRDKRRSGEQNHQHSDRERGLEILLERIQNSQLLTQPDKWDLLHIVETSYTQLRSNVEKQEFQQHVMLLIALRENSHWQGKGNEDRFHNQELLAGLARNTPIESKNMGSMPPAYHIGRYLQSQG